MRLTQQLNVLLSEDNAQIDKYIEQLRQLDDVGVTTKADGVRVLATSAANIAVDFTEVTNAKYLLIIAFDAIQFRLNDAASQLIDLTPIPAVTTTVISNTQKASQPARLFLGPTDITSLFLTNPSDADTARVFVALIGETV